MKTYSISKTEDSFDREEHERITEYIHWANRQMERDYREHLHEIGILKNG